MIAAPSKLVSLRRLVRRTAPQTAGQFRVGNDLQRVLGIDPSLNSTGYAYRTNTGLTTGRLEPGKLRGPWRLNYMRLQLEKIIDRAQPTLVVYEDYAMGARGNNMFHIGELGGVLKTLVWDKGIDCLEVSPTMMKSIIARSGRAEKQDIINALKARFGLVVSNHDEADAAGLMLLGEMKCGLYKVSEKEQQSKHFASVLNSEITRGRLQMR